MLKLSLKFSSISLYPPLNQSQRQASSRKLFEKLGFPDKPKKPKNSFLLFCDDLRKELELDESKYSVVELSSIASAKWKKISPEKKKIYEEAALKNMKSFKENLSKYNLSLSDTIKTSMKEAEENFSLMKEEKLKKVIKNKKFKELNRPKKPVPPFLKYVLSVYKDDNIALKEVVKKIKGTWSSLPIEIKNKYEDEYEAEKKEYFNKLEEWEQKMIKLGHHDLVRSKTLKRSYKDMDKL